MLQAPTSSSSSSSSPAPVAASSPGVTSAASIPETTAASSSSSSSSSSSAAVDDDGYSDVNGFNSVVQQARAALLARQTVYIGETHFKDAGRRICRELINGGGVSSFCIEFDTSEQEFLEGTEQGLHEGLNSTEKVLGHRTKKENDAYVIGNLTRACGENNVPVRLVDFALTGMVATDSTVRQQHIAGQIQQARQANTHADRGVLVLIGEYHLQNMNEQIGKHTFVWQALPGLVSDQAVGQHIQFWSSRTMWQPQ